MRAPFFFRTIAIKFVCLCTMNRSAQLALSIITFTLLLSSPLPGYCQQISMQSLVADEEALIENTRSYYLRKMESEMIEFSYQEKGRWLKYVPRLGFSLTRLTPIAEYDTRLLYEATNHQTQKNAKLLSIQKKNELAFQKTVNSLKSLYRLLENKVEYYNAYLAVDELKSQQMNIIEQQYQNAEIPPSQYLQAKITAEEHRVNRIKEYNAILELNHQITELAKTEDTPPLLTEELP